MIKVGLEIPYDKIVHKWFDLMIENILLDKNIKIVGIRYRKPFKKNKASYGIFNLLQKYLYKNNLKKREIDNLLEQIEFKRKIEDSTGLDPDFYLACGTDINYLEEELSVKVLRFFLDGIPYEMYTSGIKNSNVKLGINIEGYLFSNSGVYKTNICRIKISRLFLMTKNNIGKKLTALINYTFNHSKIWVEAEKISSKNYNYFITEWYLFLSLMRVIERHKLNRIKRKWYLYFKDKEKMNKNTFSALNVEQWEKIRMPDDVFWADPICVHNEDRDFIFIEEYRYCDKKGCIAVLEQTGKGYNRLGIALKKDYHLSFPFIFSFENRLYMIPESNKNRTVELYECVEFPMKWKFYKNLFHDIKACDTVLFFYDNIWWMFTAMESNNWGFDEQLCLFYTTNPVNGEWISHPQNPIVLGADCARMAGAIICKDNKIIRPAQDSLEYYGDKMRLFEIIELTTNTYEEKEIGIIEANSNSVIGTHTLCIGTEDIIIDVQKRR